jgi:signal transduction histidine kinase
MSANVLVILYSIATTINFVFMVVILLKSNKEPEKWFFGISAGGSCLWCFIWLLAYATFQPKMLQFSYIIGLTISTFFSLSLYYFRQNTKYLFPLTILIFIPFLFGIFMPFKSIFIFTSFTPLIYEAQPIAAVLRLYTQALLIGGLSIHLVSYYKHKDKAILISFIATFVYITFSLTTNTFLSDFFGITQFTNIGALGSVFWVLISTFAVIKYDFLKIKLVIKKSFYYSALFAVLFSILMSANNLIIESLDYSTFWKMAIFVFLGMILYERASKSLYKITENIFVKRKHNFRDVIDMSESLETQKARADERSKYANQLEQLIKEKKQTQQALINQSKEAIIGRIAGSIAHELKNPLASIKELLCNAKDNPELITKYGDKGVAAVEHGFDIINILLNSFRNSEIQFANIELDELVKETLKLFNLNIKNSNIKINTSLEKSTIKGSRVDLQQVLMNILSNAKDALTNTTNPQIMIRIDNNTIIISDNGEGISSDIQDKIFDPFFTTKGVGKGTGLGLYLVKQILDKHKAHIDLDNNDDKTIFTITF